jgi:hypothetical protein
MVWRNTGGERLARGWGGGGERAQGQEGDGGGEGVGVEAFSALTGPMRK